MEETKQHLKKWELRGKITAVLEALLCSGMFLSGITHRENYVFAGTGLKYYRNYTPEKYTYQPQNWCIIQNQRGFIYVVEKRRSKWLQKVSGNQLLE